MAIRFFAVLVLLAALVAACSSEPPPTLPGFPETTTIAIDDRELIVAVAETPASRARGLMGVTDLGGIDGMLFVFDADTESGFWMKDTLIPLDIAFFAADGAVVNVLTMVPCTTDECPRYRAGAPYRHAVEAPAGDLGFVTADSTLVIDG